MDERHLNQANSKLMASEKELWIPSLPPKDQEKVNRFRKKQRKRFNERGASTSRTLWDWLNLVGVLAIPFVVTVLGLYLTQQITQQQAQLSNTANQLQHQTDLQIAADQQRETTLKTYLDDMSDLLLNHNLRNSKPGDEVSEVAKERTLTALRRLDAERNKIVLQFLQDTHLIGIKNAVIDLSDTDLNGDNLSGANLAFVNLSVAHLNGALLSGANLYGADLSLTSLSGADLSGARLALANLNFADLSNANLSGADLSGANLNSANLRNANLRGANLTCIYFQTLTGKIVVTCTSLRGALLLGAKLACLTMNGIELCTSLIGADLSCADLRGAIVTKEQLADAASLKGAIMPNGVNRSGQEPPC